jgi:hypothetical protein
MVTADLGVSDLAWDCPPDMARNDVAVFGSAGKAEARLRRVGRLSRVRA